MTSPNTTTLGELQQGGAGGWVRAYCNRIGCGRSRPIAIAFAVIRWGADASSDVLRRNLRCDRCGHRGATLMHPSWAAHEQGWEPFPIDRP